MGPTAWNRDSGFGIFRCQHVNVVNPYRALSRALKETVVVCVVVQIRRVRVCPAAGVSIVISQCVAVSDVPNRYVCRLWSFPLCFFYVFLYYPTILVEPSLVISAWKLSTNFFIVALFTSISFHQLYISVLSTQCVP